LSKDRLNSTLKSEILEKLRKEIGNGFSCELDTHVSSTFKVGGTADITVKPKNERELELCLQVLRSFDGVNIPLMTLGSGSNILVADSGVKGVIIKLGEGFKDITFTDTVATVGAAAILAKLTNAAGDMALSGLESTLGIPGTVGGALVMNAGTDIGNIGDIVKSVSIMRKTGERKTLIGEELKYQYRQSQFLGDYDTILTSAEIELKEGDLEEIKRKMDELKERRTSRQPQGINTAGSTFKNIVDEAASELIDRDSDLSGSTGRTSNIVAAGKLIDLAGCKGWSVGKAYISEQHANFIEAREGATAQDILDLTKRVQEKVCAEFEVELELEIQLIGF